MKFFLDESGDFVIPATCTEHKAAVVVGVAVSEACEADVVDQFHRFVDTLGSTEFHCDEPKGTLLTVESTRRFCEFIARSKGILLAPVTLDLSELSEGRIGDIAATLASGLQEFAPQCVHESMRAEMRLLARRARNLSQVEMLKLVLWTYGIQELIHHAVAFMSDDEHRSSWGSVRFEIDPINVKPDSREKLVFEIMVMSWLSAWSSRRPLAMIREIHTDDHPFIRSFCPSDNKFDISKLLRGNIHWPRSCDSWGLQIADIAANIIFRAVHDLRNQRNDIPPLLRIMSKCQYHASDGPGLVTLLGRTGSSPAEKWSPLVKAIGTRYPERVRGKGGLRHPPKEVLEAIKKYE